MEPRTRPDLVAMVEPLEAERHKTMALGAESVHNDRSMGQRLKRPAMVAGNFKADSLQVFSLPRQEEQEVVVSPVVS